MRVFLPTHDYPYYLDESISRFYGFLVNSLLLYLAEKFL